jgi:hypothetical protein
MLRPADTVPIDKLGDMSRAFSDEAAMEAAMEPDR